MKMCCLAVANQVEVNNLVMFFCEYTYADVGGSLPLTCSINAIDLPHFLNLW